jgi:hypothetical protein
LQTLDASNDLNFLEAWDPNVSHTWDSVLTTVALSAGDFDPRLIAVDATEFKNPVSGTFTVVQEGTNLNLQYDPAVSNLAGDYNQDGTVDAADYVVWRENDGPQSGYDIWRANFGKTAGANAGISAAVPEPPAWALSLGALCLLALGNIRHLGKRGRYEFTSASELVNVQNGTSVSNHVGYFGVENVSHGAATVDGADSNWTNYFSAIARRQLCT